MVGLEGLSSMRLYRAAVLRGPTRTTCGEKGSHALQQAVRAARPRITGLLATVRPDRMSSSGESRRDGQGSSIERVSRGTGGFQPGTPRHMFPKRTREAGDATPLGARPLPRRNALATICRVRWVCTGNFLCNTFTYVVNIFVD